MSSDRKELIRNAELEVMNAESEITININAGPKYHDRLKTAKQNLAELKSKEQKIT